MWALDTSPVKNSPRCINQRFASFSKAKHFCAAILNKQQRACRSTFTCGSACMTVSRRALIPLAIFSSFSTAEGHRKKGLKQAKLHSLPMIWHSCFSKGGHRRSAMKKSASVTQNLSKHLYLYKILPFSIHFLWSGQFVCVYASTCHLTSCYS